MSAVATATLPPGQATSAPAAPPLLAGLEASAGSGDPAQLVTAACGLAQRPVISTNFRPGAAALLHLVTRVLPDIPVIWVDTGYNTPATYRYVAALRDAWALNLHVYTPRVSAAHRAALSGGVPQPASSAFERFVEETKLEPFRRAFTELDPDVWFTGVRREQSEFRRALAPLSQGPGNSVRVAPLLDWSAADVAAYLARHGIEDNDDYVDPTKPGAHLECGIQLLR